ncbi:TlpA family protein disulfide reductase [Mycolicibacterium phlei]|uniref:Membrane protein n=2 Tax=Mycolicibacterium phlei TaxID=1771 RepID=A0A5N5VAR4_MYCPH|nr:TlpA disulfide reductase family protein [Mycolicibacterium phlei]VEG07368.1 thiol-disulfide isomerase-like thioredoxin [Mycobacteroides chelonae]AMO59236.1 Thiol-disulfide oxidoreductase ResA [Mycolicibacterium phlei]KAB7759032.1 membrane protein [Mycolicibacterium phlei DSM 43239 = CCUG 21000]KXW59754.1 membrane protein [Mycolicibacterium phlei DSM 43072]KXW67517.1 membrane protein [Mycolicibacterium phlei DSM 43239 = CCUG 21000]
MRSSTRWTVVVLVILMALGWALWAELEADDPAPDTGRQTTARDRRDADTPEALAGPRARADLAPCPGPGAGPGPESLRGITLECVGDGALVDVAEALAGRAVVLNLWAYWCGPCTEELPAMAEYQRRVGPAVTVLTVHQDENETAALLRLAELGVRLPTLQDGRRRIAAALRVPNVMPATVVLRADGTVADILPRPFTSADEIAAAVNPQIGVTG